MKLCLIIIKPKVGLISDCKSTTKKNPIRVRSHAGRAKPRQSPSRPISQYLSGVSATPAKPRFKRGKIRSFCILLSQFNSDWNPSGDSDLGQKNQEFFLDRDLSSRCQWLISGAALLRRQRCFIRWMASFRPSNGFEISLNRRGKWRSERASFTFAATSRAPSRTSSSSPIPAPPASTGYIRMRGRRTNFWIRSPSSSRCGAARRGAGLKEKKVGWSAKDMNFLYKDEFFLFIYVKIKKLFFNLFPYYLRRFFFCLFL